MTPPTPGAMRAAEKIIKLESADLVADIARIIDAETGKDREELVLLTRLALQPYGVFHSDPHEMAKNCLAELSSAADAMLRKLGMEPHNLNHREYNDFMDALHAAAKEKG